MYCPYCGTKLEDNSIFCTDCGKRVNEPQANVPQTTNISETSTQAPTQTPAVQTPAQAPAPEVKPVPAPAPVAPQPAPVQEPAATATPAFVPKPTATPAPKAVPAATPKPAPAPKPVKIKKERKPIVINKKMIVTVILLIVLALVYAATAAIPFLLMDRTETVVVTTIFDDDVFGYFTLKDFAGLLMNGNKLFNPTSVSLTLAICVQVFTYCVPVFAGIAFIAACANKKSVPLHVLSSIMTGLYSVIIALSVPLSTWLIPNFKDAIAVSLKFIMGDVASVSSTAFIIVAGIMMGLVVISSILVGIIAKRRAK